MRRIHYFLLIITLFCASASAQAEESRLRKFLFEENKGQFHENVLFRAEIPSGYLFIERNGLTYSFHNAEEKHEVLEFFHHFRNEFTTTKFRVQAHVLKLYFLEGQIPEASPTEPTSYYFNYYVNGNDARKHATNVRSYEKVRLNGIYPGIDLEFYTGFDGSLKYDWIVAKGADPSQIRLGVEGADDMSLEQGYLKITHSLGVLTETPPITLSEHPTAPFPQFHFNIIGDEVRYEAVSSFGQMANTADAQYRIDPKLIFSTYSGSRGDNFGFTATYDSEGHLYAGGITDGYFGQYPVTAGAYQTEFGGGEGLSPANLACDITISKYDSAGTTLLYATYLGGARDEYPHSLVVDKNDQLLVMGTSYSSDFPFTLTAYDTTHNGNTDIIVSKFSVDGKQLLASTFVGGSGRDGLNSNGSLRYNYADDYRGDIFMDESNNAYIASSTNSSDFPMVNAVDNTIVGSEGCAFQLNEDLSQLEWSTFWGGSGADALYSIKVDVDSNIVVGGGSNSDTMHTTTGVLNKKRIGGIDGIIAIFDQGTKEVKAASYFGTGSYDQIYFVEINNEGSIFVAGQTEGNIKPSSGVYGESNKGQFVAKIDTSLQNIEFQTSFGVRNNQIDIAPTAFLVDNCEHIYMSGWGSVVRPDLHPGSTTDLEITSDAEQPTTDGNDFYIIVLDKDAQSLLYATYFGGDSTSDHVDGGTSRFDKKGVIYQSVCSSCPNGNEGGRQDFPVTPDAAFTTNLSPRCSNASFKIDLQIRTAVDAYFRPDPPLGCAPLDVHFENFSRTQAKFIWDFGDGNTDTVNYSPDHRYEEPGTYEVTLTVIDSNTCNISDVFKRSIYVYGHTDATFEYELEPCVYEASFTTSSKGPDYYWDFGDGQTSTEKNPKHQYEPGMTYTATLIVNPNTLCSDTATSVIETAPKGGDDLFIPNVFTPGADGFNDFFCLDGLNPGCDSIEWIIYNRWGERVFHSNSVYDCWDGRTGGKNLPSGTYFSIFKIWRFELDDEYTVSGTVTLIRDSKRGQ